MGIRGIVAVVLRFVVFLSVLLVSRSALAHVGFDIPAGTVFEPGSVATITWRDLIPHDTIAYHLELLPADDGPAESIVRDLPSGTFNYDWQVPDETCINCQLHVVQDNSGTDYDGYVLVHISSDPIPEMTDAGVVGTGGTGGFNGGTSATGGSDAGSSQGGGVAMDAGTMTDPTGVAAGDGTLGAGSNGPGCSLGRSGQQHRSVAWLALALFALGTSRRRRHRT